MIMDCEDYTVFTGAMELHYIDMKAFAKAVNEKSSINIADAEEVIFALSGFSIRFLVRKSLCLIVQLNFGRLAQLTRTDSAS